MDQEEKRQLIRKASLNLPPSFQARVWPEPLENVELPPTEQKVYLQLSLEFHKILEDAPSFQMGAYQWHQILPDRLQEYGLTIEVWERISSVGDNSDDLQDQLAKLIEKLGLE
ncbi:MAG: hypothetical protein ACXAEU_04840 [Candidatus Hodarchaeales archaeon]